MLILVYLVSYFHHVCLAIPSTQYRNNKVSITKSEGGCFIIIIMIIKIVKQNNVGLPYHPGIISNKIQRGELFWAHPHQSIESGQFSIKKNNFDNQINYTGRLLKAQFHSNPTTILYPSYYWLNLCQYKLTATHRPTMHRMFSRSGSTSQKGLHC